MSMRSQYSKGSNFPVMTWFWPFDSFDPVPVTLLQLKMRERKNRRVTVIFDPASVTAEFEV